MKPIRLALIIALLALGALGVALAPVVAPGSVVGRQLAPRLGLDIRGGARVVLEADKTKLPAGQSWNQDTRAAVLNIITKRVNANGVAEAFIAPKGGPEGTQYIVELPGVENREQIIGQLQNTARLEFYYSPDWLTRKNTLGRYELRPEGESGEREQYKIFDRTTSFEFRDPYHINLALKDLLDRGSRAANASDVTEVTLPEPLRSLSAAGPDERVRVPAKDAKEVEALAKERQAFDAFLKQAKLELTGNDLNPNARAQLDNAGKPLVELQFNNDGRQKFAEFTRRHTDEILMIYLDGQILMAPNINEPITQGTASISPFASVRDAQRLADYLNGGALPVPLRILQQQSIEPTLGREAVQSGMVAGIVGLGLVLLFMVGYYLLPGAVACAALILYTLFTYAIFALIPVTFTLPGIAGFILSVGMAVDANILIFERTKEELRAGKTLRAAIESGFQRAFSAILDSNVCTAITSVLLYQFGTGPVRGFALTLLIGVAVSMFTAITATRTFLLLLVNSGAGRNLAAWGVNRTFQPRLNVVRQRNFWFGLSIALIVPGLIYAFMGGFKPGIDFTGGSEVAVALGRPVTRAEVERVVATQGVEDPVAQIAGEQGGRNLVYVRTPQIPQDKADAIVTALGQQLGTTAELREYSTIGSAISAELTRNAFLSIALSSVLIVLYLALRFSIGGFGNGLKFGICAVVAMLHDVAVVVGAFAVLGYLFNWKADSLFVTAALTVVGFSVHDTIVIFDRIRENLRNRARGESFEDLVNKSINETVGRSVNTSLTVMLTLVALLVLGGPVIRPLNAALLIGILSGTFSSIFNAAPLIVVWERLAGRRGSISAIGQPVAAVAGGGGGGAGRSGDVPRPAPPLTPSGPASPGRAGDTGEAAGGDGAERTVYGARPDQQRPSAPPAARRRRRM